MGGSSAKDTAAKQRIIQHMNKDHQDSLARFLQFYCRLPPKALANAHLEDITLDHMILTATGHRQLVPFTPPLQDWSETRQRVVQMDQVARDGLGQSDIVITEYQVPRSFSAVVFAAALSAFIFFSRPQNALPGSWTYDYILYRVPAFARFLHAIQVPMISFMISLHLAESVWFDRSRLQKYGVPRFTSLWLTWIVSCFIEGVGAFARVDDMVKQQRKAKTHQ
ncbi:MAG: hypothetical protein M1838_001881 [Thelocarpon superellum]|nr:MAG: hypothetical protein M1838_001881 [Thelocarpon superellum]